MAFYHRLISKIFLKLSLLRRGMTLGVRAIILKEEAQVFLVKHTYVPGWYLPGGGVEVGQTLHQALEKELSEEANIRLTGPATFFAVYQNRHISTRDHVALYFCPHWQQEKMPQVPNREILDVGFFPLDDLPADTTSATRKRLKEFLETKRPDAYW